MSLKCYTNMLFHSSHYSMEIILVVVKIKKIPDLTNLTYKVLGSNVSEIKQNVIVISK